MSPYLTFWQNLISTHYEPFCLETLAERSTYSSDQLTLLGSGIFHSILSKVNSIELARDLYTSTSCVKFAPLF